MQTNRAFNTSPRNGSAFTPTGITTGMLLRLPLRLIKAVKCMLKYHANAIQIARERHQLTRLDPRMMEDIGIRHGDAQKEIERGFYDLPDMTQRKAKPRR